MNSICFSLVLYKHSVEDISPLLDSISAFVDYCPDRRILLCIYDASPPTYVSPSEDCLKLKCPKFEIIYNKRRNVGFGIANNYNFSSASLSDQDLFVIANPDIQFSPSKLLPLLNWTLSHGNCSCVAPLVLLNNGSVQYSAKRNPTFLSLFLGRFSFLNRFSFFSEYDKYHKNMHRDYHSDEIDCTYLSGCFLIVPVWAFIRVHGFCPRYFLHVEDADLVRRLNRIGRTLHNPVGLVVHGRARGSHSSLRQIFALCKSYLVYCLIWGFKLF